MDIATVTYDYSEVFPKNHDTDRKPRTWHTILSTGHGVAQIDLATGRLQSFNEKGQNETVWTKAKDDPAGADVMGSGTISQGFWVVSKEDRDIEKRRAEARRTSRQTIK